MASQDKKAGTASGGDDNGKTPGNLQFRLVLLVTLSVLSLFVLLGLGTWQVERMFWKEELIARIENQLALPPVSLAEIEAIDREGGSVDYRPVTLSGTFDNSKERHFFATFQGQTGYYIYTPLDLVDGRSVFINRGFVPYEQKEVSTRPQSQVTGEVTITGLARDKLDEKPSSLVPDNDLQKNIFFWKDLDVMVASSGEERPTLPFFIDADATPVAGGLPMGGVTLIDLPNSHLQYALTWYSLALILIVVASMLVRRLYKEGKETSMRRP